MLTKHLTDDEIQQYALDRSNCETKIVEHVQLCEACKAKAATYHLLFTGIKQQAAPAFDFNLSELVLTQLPTPKSSFLPESFWVYLLALCGILLTGVLLYFIRGYVVILFTGITPFLIYLIITTFITILIILSTDMYKSYQKKMSTLDFY
jgi:hypothetical protein